MLRKLSILLLLSLSALACGAGSPSATETAVPAAATATLAPTIQVNSIRSGTYATQTFENGAVCILEIKDAPSPSFYVNCNRGAPSYNQGTLSGEFEWSEPNVGLFKTDRFGPCELRFSITKTNVQVTQTGADFECGFGAGVTATGDYTFQNDQTPNLP